MAGDLERFGVSIESELLAQFDKKLSQKGYGSRSEALRDLMRQWLNVAAAAEDPTLSAMGTLTLFYDHTRRDLTDRLAHFGHEHHHLLLNTLHFHLDHQRCLEVMALKGPVGEVRAFADAVIAMKGIQHGQLVVTIPDAERSTRRKAVRHSHGPGHWHSHE